METKEGKYKSSPQLESYVSRDPFETMYSIYGERYREYREKWETSLDSPADYPIHIDIDLEDTCNLRCVHCHQNYRKRDHRVITEDLLYKIIDESAESGLCAINFGSTGEPLLQKDRLFRAIRYAEKKGIMDIFVHSNGLLLNGDTARELINAGLKHICVSLDASTQETFKQVRKSESFHQVRDNVINMVRLREKMRSITPVIRVSFVMTPLNSHEKEQFIEDWKGIVDLVEFQNYRSIDNSMKNESKFEEFTLKCNSFYRRIMIWPDGDVSLCCVYRNEDVIIGNVQGKSISEIWNGDRFRSIIDAFKSDTDLPVTCSKCLNLRYKYIG